MRRAVWGWLVLFVVGVVGLAGCSESEEPGDAGGEVVAASSGLSEEDQQPGEPAEDAEPDKDEPEEQGWLARQKARARRGLDLAEATLGNELKPVLIARHGGVYPDPALQGYLEQIVLTLAEHSERPDLPWEFVILNTDELQAMALPGGKLFITRGLLQSLESEAQFAHVMAHEMGHVVHRHTAKKLAVKAIGKLALKAAAAGERKVLARDPGDPLYVKMALGIGSHFAELKYSRGQELESDECGVDCAFAAGYDPNEAKKVYAMYLRRKQAAGKDETLLRGLLSTHPLDSDRIEHLDAYIAENCPGIEEGTTGLVVTTDEWKEHHARLRGTGAVYAKLRRAMELVAEALANETRDGLDEALDLLDEAVAELPGHAALHFARGYVHRLLGRQEAAERDLDRAIELAPAHFQARLLRGLVRKADGRYEEAAEDFEAATNLLPNSPAPYYYLGECREALGDADAARAAYEEAEDLAPKGSRLREKARAKLRRLD